ncbi:MAG TPA: hypothetical protein VHF90_06855 [Thermoleophilaceae bacterium]|nr:hypothetical protein [Thermoleophilaceae bacterium]
MSPSNGAVVVWLDGGTNAIWARRVFRDGRLGGERRISPKLGSFAEGLDVAVDRSGAAVVIWFDHDLDRGYSLHARRLDSRGRLGAVREIAPPRPLIEPTVQLAIDRATGDATIAWTQVLGTPVEPKGVNVTSATVHARRLSAGGRLTPLVELPAGNAMYPDPSVAVSSSGDAIVAWTTHQEQGYSIRAASLGAQGLSGAIQELSAPMQFWSGGGAEVVADGSRRATVAWAIPSVDGLGQTVLARALFADGPGPLQSLPGGPGVQTPAVAKDATGRALIVWGVTAGSGDPVGRRVAVDGVPSPVWQLSSPGPNRGMPELVVDASGRRATAIWADGTDVFRGPTQIQSRQIAASGGVGSVSTLADAPRMFMGRPEGVGAPDGTVLAVWSRSLRLKSTLQAARLVRNCDDVSLRRAVAMTLLPYRPGRVRGVRVRLTFDRAAEPRVASARLTFRLPGTGRSRSVVLRSPSHVTAYGVRLAVPKRLRTTLRPGQAVALRLRLRAKPLASGCPYGRARTVEVRSRVGWIDRR